jgi:methylated-DNA-[protein]-cysteine S-methyltransferase
MQTLEALGPRLFSISSRDVYNVEMTFSEKVKAIVAKIPRGKTMTYAAVARRAGNSRAARAVGAVMRANHDPKIPCHRVVRSDGGMGGYNRGGAKRKLAILKTEGAR